MTDDNIWQAFKKHYANNTYFNIEDKDKIAWSKTLRYQSFALHYEFKQLILTIGKALRLDKLIKWLNNLQ